MGRQRNTEPEEAELPNSRLERDPVSCAYVPRPAVP